VEKGDDRYGCSGVRLCRTRPTRRHQSPRARWAGATYLGKVEEAFLLRGRWETQKTSRGTFLYPLIHGPVILVAAVRAGADGLPNQTLAVEGMSRRPLVDTAQPAQPNAVASSDTAGQLGPAPD
jgi:hypothetical protein